MEVLWLLVGMALGSSFTLAIASRFPQGRQSTEIAQIVDPQPSAPGDFTQRFDQLDQQLQTLQRWHESHQTQLRGLKPAPEGRSPLLPSAADKPADPLTDAPATPTNDTNALASDVGINYEPLNQYLGLGQWAEADVITRALLTTAAGLPANGGFSAEDWQRIPATDLRTMDNLWRYWSGDRFGFSPQAQLWQALGENYQDFCDRVGWRQGEGWIYRDELQGDRSAPVGHWPAITWGARACYGHGSGVASQGMSGLMERAITVLLTP